MLVVTAVVLCALLAVLVVFLGRPRGRVSAAETAAGKGPGWEIVFDREANGATRLIVVSSSGGPERQLTSGPGNDTLARWTPDGKLVVFTSDRTGTPQLWEIDRQGGQPRRLRTNGATEYQHDLSPDGRSLAFLSNLDGPERLLAMDLDSGALREIVRHGERTIFGNPHWSPDGRQITFSSNHRMGHQIYVVDVASKEERRISNLTQGGCEPRFSRDGRKVVYVDRGHLRPTSRLVEHELASGRERSLVEWPALNYDPVYSPDGSELAFVSNITGQFALYRQRIADQKAWRLTFAPGEARNPDYRPVR